MTALLDFLTFTLVLVAGAPGASVEAGTASVVIDGCTVSLERSRNEPEVLRYRNDCAQPHEKKVAVLGELLHTVLPRAGTGTAAPPRTLFVGRLVITFPELAARLAVAASRSTAWSGARARRDSGVANGAVRRLLEDPSIAADLDRVFEAHGLSVKPASVEKVLVARAADTPIKEELASRGVKPRALVPFDAMTWFRLEPREPGQ